MGFMKSCWQGLYIVASYVAKSRRELSQDRSDEFKLPRHSQTQTFDIKTDRLYSGECINHQQELKMPRHRRGPSHDATTTELLSSLLKVQERGDSCGQSVRHALGGMAAVIPAGSYTESDIPHSTNIQKADVNGNFAAMPLQNYWNQNSLASGGS